MDKLRTHKHLLWCALALMVAFGIILIRDYTTQTSLDPLTGWLGLAALTAERQQRMLCRYYQLREFLD